MAHKLRLLTPEQVDRALMTKGLVSSSVLAAEYGCSASTIRMARSGRTYHDHHDSMADVEPYAYPSVTQRMHPSTETVTK